MAKMKLKTKGIIKKIALALAGVAALTAVGFGVKAIVDYTKNDLKTIHLSYDVGNLGADGKFVDDESTLYTKEAFGCYGLQVKPDFDSTVNYQIFYYDMLDNYISSTEVLSDGFSGEAPVNGAYARLVIEPRDDEDGKISWTEKISYPKQLTVKVKKEQDINNRFSIFQGKLMTVVNSTSDLIFDEKCFFDVTEMTWNSFSWHSTTSTTILKVTGGYTISCNFSALEKLGFTDVAFRVYQFSDLPLNDNIISNNFGKEYKDSVVLDRKTKYVMLSAFSGEINKAWTDAAISLLPSCFSITKN